MPKNPKKDKPPRRAQTREGRSPDLPTTRGPQPEPEIRPDHGLPLVPPDGGEEALADEIDNAVPTFGYDMLPVVGLGASAGGIPALTLFLENTPDTTGRMPTWW